jgi:very-short-patch-repair endonuclease
MFSIEDFFMGRKLTQSEFELKARLTHDDAYQYHNDYVNNRTKISITCNCGLEFKQTPAAHLIGQGCPRCCRSSGGRLTTNSFIDKANDVHGGIYDYSKVEYSYNIIPVCIICKDHSEFMQTPHDHLSGCGCPMCKESVGEREVRKVLECNNISYEFQYRFDDCRDSYPLPFDFFIPDMNLLIEYDGIQHYEPVDHFGGLDNLKIVQKRDSIKNKYVKDNGIKLIRIHYKEIDMINEKLKELICGLV